MFTDRFIKVPMELFTKNAEHVGFNESSKTADIEVRINPLDISYYRENFDEGESTYETYVLLKSGEGLVLNCSLQEFEKLLNA